MIPAEPSEHNRQRQAEKDVENFRDMLGPFVTAAESTRMPMAFANACASGNPLIFVNDSMVKLTGYRREELLGRTLASLISPDASPESAQHIADQFDGNTHRDVEIYFRRCDESDFWASVFVTPVCDHDESVIQHFVSLIDLTRHKQHAEALRLSEGRFRMAAAAAGLGVADVDLVRGEEYWSAELRDIFGVADDVPAAMETYIALIHPDDRDAAGCIHSRALRGEAISKEEGVFRIIRASDGEVRWIASERHATFDGEGVAIRLILTNRDITAEKTANDRVAWIATHDSVTGLPNRISFRSRLEDEFVRAIRSNGVVSLLLIDLDRFKQINDLLGHQAGDQALSALARRIAVRLPAGTMLARLGGDEFVTILPGLDSMAAAQVAAGLLDALTASFDLGERRIDLRISMGISTFPGDGKVPSQLIHSADLALYAAKKDGGATARIYAPFLRAERQGQLAMLRHARTALKNDWIRPFYQPQIMLATGEVGGFEALLRWDHPRAGLQYPATIAHAFDDTHLAGLLGIAIVDAVFSDMRRWAQSGMALRKIAINVSAAEFRDPAYGEKLLARLTVYQIPPAMVELEITETAFLDEGAGGIVAALITLRQAGISVALDDFGTGFSSLSHLRDLPVDTIKIDRSFVDGIDNSARDRSITEAVLLLGAALGMTTIAEGVETETQAEFLKARGCTYAQGFLYSPAVDTARAEHYMGLPHSRRQLERRPRQDRGSLSRHRR